MENQIDRRDDGCDSPAKLLATIADKAKPKRLRRQPSAIRKRPTASCDGGSILAV